MAKYFLIAGEASGDTHAARLMTAIRKRDAQAVFVGLGGDCMAAAGCRLYQDFRSMAFMGIAAVLRNHRQVRENFRIASEALRSEQPDALILIDYPSFNLRIAAFVRKVLPATKIYYYIPPKAWAWKRWRVHEIARLSDEVLGIFPFEPDFYARFGYRCTYVGHPTVEEIQQRSDLTAQRSYSAAVLQSEGRSFIALLPGSRLSEVTHCLPVMLDAARRMPAYRIIVTAANGIDDEVYTRLLHEGETLTRDTYAAIRNASFAIVNSGTATLETALLGCPQVAVYYLACSRLIGLIRGFVQPLLFSIPYFTPVNILLKRDAVHELLANDFTANNIHAALQDLEREGTAAECERVRQELLTRLGTQSASENAAKIIVK